MKTLWKCPKEVRAICAPLLKKHLHLIPSWCHELRFEFASESNGSVIARAYCQPEYRAATIEIHPNFLLEAEAERVDAFMHELIHLQLAPMVHCTRSIISAIVEEGTPLFDLSWEQQRTSMEGVVEDLRRAFESRG